MSEEYDEQFESEGSDAGGGSSTRSSPPDSTRMPGGGIADIAATLKRPTSSAVPRGSKPRSRSRSRSPPRSHRASAAAAIRDDALYYDDASDGMYGDEDAETRARLANTNSDIRTASGTLEAASNVKKLRPGDVAALKGLSGDAWNKKLEQLVSTVKGEKYSRAPSTGSAALLIDSTAALGGRSSGFAVDHRDPYSRGTTSGSYLSASPPASAAQAKADHLASVASSAALFNIARVADGAVYGSKAYAGKRGGKAAAQAFARLETGTRILDKFAQDEEEMLAEQARLKKAVAACKADLATLARERELLDEHLRAQSRVLDEQALKKGYIRLSGGVSLSAQGQSGPGAEEAAEGGMRMGINSVAPEKPRYEKLATLQGASGGSTAGGKLSLEEQLLTLQVQQRSLRLQKAALQKELDSAQDHHGTLSSHADADAEAERASKRILLAELHTLQQQMMEDKRAHEQETAEQERIIADLREQARVLQAQMDVQRQLLAGSTLNYQQQQDRKAAMQAKIAAVRKRLQRYQAHG